MVKKRITKKEWKEKAQFFGKLWGKRVCKEEPEKFQVWYDSTIEREGELYAKEFKKAFQKCMKEKTKRG